MKRFFAASCLLMALSLNSCQCAWKPDPGPVEDEQESAQVVPGPRA